MLYIVLTTGKCNLNCRYCGGSFPPDLVPWEITYSVETFREFIKRDPDPIIAFYGGEPLLNTEFIREVMKNQARFIIQTNGTLSNRLEPKLWRRFDAILLSIDGRRQVTDYYRGAGIYDKVVDTTKWLRNIGWEGDLIARMVVSEHSDIFLDVKHLLSLNLFDHIHWQLDAVWSTDWKNFGGWCEESYMPGVSRLIRLWIDEARVGRMLGLVPFVAVLKMMIKGEEMSRPPCEAGVNSLAILTNGDVLACPIAFDAQWARLGNLVEGEAKQMLHKVKIGEPCTSCSYLRYCGGRCLYAHYEKFWGEDGFKRICGVTAHLINGLLNVRSEVLRLLEKRVISIYQLDYPTFNNTTEIIP